MKDKELRAALELLADCIANLTNCIAHLTKRLSAVESVNAVAHELRPSKPPITGMPTRRGVPVRPVP